MSYRTCLCMVNFSGKPIKATTVSVDSNDDWDGASRPDRNFGGKRADGVGRADGGALADGDARSVRAEINSKNGSWFRLDLTFDDNSTLGFRVNQSDACASGATALNGLYTQALTASTENADLEVYRVCGEDRYTRTNAFYIRPKTAPDNSDWMTRLLARDTTLKLNQITMPGSHDAGMYLGANEWSKTQLTSIGGQLQAGSRYFDLRVYHSGELKTAHGNTDGGTLKEILGHVKGFLAAHPKEAVFLKFRDVGTQNYRKETVEFVKSELGDRLYKAASPPNFARAKLITFAGKAVAFFHTAFEDSLLNASEGTFRYTDYGNENTGAPYTISDHQCFGVYDAYSHQSDILVMKPDQIDKWDKYGGLPGRPYLFLLSWTLTGSTDNVLDLVLLANTANPQQPEVLQGMEPSAKKGAPNIVYMDCVDPWLCARAIAMNPALKKGANPGDLYWHAHDGWINGTPLALGAEKGVKIGGGGWTGFQSIFATGAGVFYGVDTSGNLHRYRDEHWDKGGADMSLGAGSVVGDSGWDSYKLVFASSDGVIYGVDRDGVLWRYEDSAWRQGDARVGPRSKLADGWASADAAFATNNGVLYAVKGDSLYRYRDSGNGSALGETLIGTNGWGKYKSVFASSDGIIYAIEGDNLVWHRDTKWKSGDGHVVPGKTVGAGWGKYVMTFATTSGHIYGVAP